MMNQFQGEYTNINFLLKKAFVQQALLTHRGEWQALQDDRPQMSTWELYDISIDIAVPPDISLWQDWTHPNLPWAEDHFQERVGGVPLNPGEQYKNWPWYEGGVEEHKGSGKFSHTYMERMWGNNRGAGDVGDIAFLLQNRPMTRQAYLSIWWPEDQLANLNGHRVPCSLGYLFQIQESRLVCYYYMRSVDFLRYLWDDLYMAGRLLQHIAIRSGLEEYPLGLHTKIANLHIFEPELKRVEEEYNKEQSERLSRAFG